MKINRGIICGALLFAALLAGCDTSTQATPPPTPSTSQSVMTSQPVPASGTPYPGPEGYPVPNSSAATAYPAPTGTP